MLGLINLTEDADGQNAWYVPAFKVQDIESAGARQLYAYWKSKSLRGPFPARRDLDPLIDVPHLAPNIALVDVLHQPRRFRYRLVGTAVSGLTGEGVTGRFIDRTLYPTSFETLFDQLAWAADRSAATLLVERRYLGRQHWGEVTWINLPLSTDGSMIDMLLRGGWWVERPDQPAPRSTDDSAFGHEKRFDLVE